MYRCFDIILRYRWHTKRPFPDIERLKELTCTFPSPYYVLLFLNYRGAAKISALQCCLAHSQCRGDCPIELIQALVLADPSSVNQQHFYTGSTPLHATFYNGFFSSSKRTTVARALLEACPQSIKTTNNDGKTALHTNASQHCNYEPTLLLLEAAPEITTWMDNNGDLPLHCACRSHKSPSKSIIAIFKQYPAGIITRNKKGLTPVDEARLCALTSSKKKSRLKVLRRLLREYRSEYQSVNDNNGHGHTCKKRRVDLTAPSGIHLDRNFVGDERDDSGTIQRKDDDETRMPSLGGKMSVSDEGSDREMIDSSILLAMMKNHTVI